MRLLNYGVSILEYSYRAHEYWSGRQGLSDTPFWEFVLELPVKIGKRVDWLRSSVVLANLSWQREHLARLVIFAAGHPLSISHP